MGYVQSFFDSTLHAKGQTLNIYPVNLAPNRWGDRSPVARLHYYYYREGKIQSHMLIIYRTVAICGLHNNGIVNTEVNMFLDKFWYKRILQYNGEQYIEGHVPQCGNLTRFFFHLALHLGFFIGRSILKRSNATLNRYTFWWPNDDVLSTDQSTQLTVKLSLPWNRHYYVVILTTIRCIYFHWSFYHWGWKGNNNRSQ